jgi:short-subunit dehydrogenase
MSFKNQTWWIIGASEGLGRALAEALDKEGASLILSARNADRLQALSDGLSDAQALPMDVTDARSVASAAEAASDADGVIYCAGLYDPMTVQEWEPETAEAICEVNFMGAMRAMGRVAPRMARRGHGHIVLIGSLAGFTGLPGAIGYGASKAAVMHLGENLHRDLRDSGVKVQVVNPGFIKTRLTAKNDFKMPMIQTPEDAAACCIKAMRSNRFQTSFPAPFSWVFRIAALLPRKLVTRLI